MIPVGCHMGCTYVLVGVNKKRLHRSMHGGPVGCERKQPVPAFCSDKRAGVVLAVDRIARHQHAGQVQKRQPFTRRDDVVRAAGHRRLAEHQTPVRSERADHMQSRAARGLVEGATQGLAVDSEHARTLVSQLVKKR